MIIISSTAVAALGKSAFIAFYLNTFLTRTSSFSSHFFSLQYFISPPHQLACELATTPTLAHRIDSCSAVRRACLSVSCRADSLTVRLWH